MLRGWNQALGKAEARARERRSEAAGRKFTFIFSNLERLSSLFDIFNYAGAEPISRTKKKSGLQLKQLGNFTPASEEQCCLGVWRLSETRDHLSALLDRRNLNVLQNPRPGQELRAWPCKPLLMVFSQSTQETGKMSLSCCSLCPGFLARFLEGQKSILQCGINCVRICNFTVGNTAISDGE